MTVINLTDLASFKAYFQNIAAQHQEILGFKWGGKIVLKTATKSNLVNKFLFAQPYDSARYAGADVDNLKKVKTARIGFFQTSASEKFDDEQAAYEFCEKIIEDVVSRILNDKAGQLVGEDWQMIIANIQSMKAEPVKLTLGSTKFIGCDLVVDILDNANLEFDASIWKDTRTFSVEFSKEFA
jgi:hypothetical protein